MKVRLFLFFFLSFFSIKGFCQALQPANAWALANDIVNNLKEPTFPDKTFFVTDFGATGDGHTLNTEPFRKAIESCSKSGGGTVVVPAGLWLTGPIELQSNVNLHFERGALVVFSPDHNNYPIIKPPKRSFTAMSPIYGANLENIAVTGEGVLDGSGDTWRPVKKSKTTESQWKNLVKSGGVVDEQTQLWWPSQEALNGEQFIKDLNKKNGRPTAEDFLPARDFLRPYMVLLANCKNVLIDGPTFKNSPKFALVPSWCENVIFRNVKINNEWWAQNGDGIDISSCKNVLVDRCTVTAGDDGIAMKSSEDKEIGNPTLENVVVRNCIVYQAHGGFVIGSNTDGGMRNVFVSNCNFIGTDVGLRFKSARDRGALVEDIYVKNIFMKDIVEEAILFDTYYEDKGPGAKAPAANKFTPRFEKFYIDSIYCDGAKQAVLVKGLPEMPIKDIQISNSYISAGKGFESLYADGFKLSKVEIVAKKGPVYSFDQSSDFVLDHVKIPAKPEAFLQVDGASTKNIIIQNTGQADVSKSIRYGNNANTNSVIIK